MTDDAAMLARTLIATLRGVQAAMTSVTATLEAIELHLSVIREVLGVGPDLHGPRDPQP